MNLPGTARHQELLRGIMGHYVDDPRILGVVIFGSLARGDWDEWSDIDLDVVLHHGGINVAEEGRRLAAVLGDGHPVVVIRQSEDACDVVLESLDEISIRWHTLDSTSPNIVDDFLILAGSLDRDEFRARGQANRGSQTNQAEQGQSAARCVRYLIEADLSLRRGRMWEGIDRLERVRHLLTHAWRSHRGDKRPDAPLDERVCPELCSRLAGLLPSYDPASIDDAIDFGVDLLLGNMSTELTAVVQPDEAERTILHDLRKRRTTSACHE